MNKLLTEAELTGALTDLLAGLILIPLLIILYKTATEREKEKRYWVWFFLCLDVAFLMGYMVHYHVSGVTAQKFIWVFLYGFMMETTLLLLLIGICILAKDEKPDKGLSNRLHLAELPTYLSVVIPEMLTGRRMIVLCVAYCTVITTAGLILMILAGIKQGEMSALIPPLSFIPLIPASIIQIKHDALIHITFDFDHNGIAHLLIIAAVFVLFAGARKRIKD